MKVCFFALLSDHNLFDTIGFYKNDIQILTDLGFEVIRARKLSEVSTRCDLYVSWFPYCGGLLWPMLMLRRKPHITIGNLHAAIPSYARQHRLKDRVILILEKWGVQQATLSLPTSRLEEELFIQLKARQVKLVYHGFHTDVYIPLYQSAKTLKRTQILTVTHINAGNYLRKCIGEIIESIPMVVQQYPDAMFVVCGQQDPQIMNMIDSRLQALGVADHAIFPGRITEAEKVSYMQESTIYLQPTLYEGFGFAIAEAMSCGLPVITSPVGSVPEVVGDVGLYCAGDQPSEISEQVCRLLADQRLCHDLGNAGRERVCRMFSYQRRRAEIAAAIESVFDNTKIQLDQHIVENIRKFIAEAS